MNMSTEEFVKIADDVCRHYEQEIADTVRKALREVVIKMYEKGLSVRNYNEDKTSFKDSWEWILLRQRVESMLRNRLSWEVVSFSDIKLVNELEEVYNKEKES